MTYAPQHTTVWTEIPVTDLDKAMAFYSVVTGIALKKETEMGPNPIAMFMAEDHESGVAGHLYPGTPAADGAGPTIHLASPGKLEDTLGRVRDAGGTVLSDIITIPAGRFGYCQDLDGNSVAFFETDTAASADQAA